MPLSDLEAPSNNGDGALETLAAAEEEEEEEEEEESDPEMPPESFRIGIGEEFDWAELNAVLDRDDSTRGSANPKSQQQQHHHHHHHHANPSKPRSDDSQRFSGIIVLPGAIPISGAYLGRSARRATRKKMAGNGGGKAVPETDPGSPKVSCAGKVMSQSHRRRNPGFLRRSPDVECEGQRGGRRGSFVAAALRLFRGHCGGGASPSENAPAPAPAPGLGGMKGFASGRRGECSCSCGGDADGGMHCHVAISRPLDREVVAGNASVGPFEEMGRDRD